MKADKLEESMFRLQLLIMLLIGTMIGSVAFLAMEYYNFDLLGWMMERSAGHSPAPVKRTETVVPDTHPAITCPLRSICRNEETRLIIRQPHAASLRILDPDNREFYLAREFEKGETQYPFSQEEFRNTSNFLLVPKDTVGVLQKKDGTYKLTKVFTKTGWYIIELVSNVDDPIPTVTGSCAVFFENRGFQKVCVSGVSLTLVN